MSGGGAVSLLCLAAGSGLPLFCRPPRPQVPFPVAGALHAALLYGHAAGAGLRGAATRGTHVAWRGFHSVTLIALSSEPGVTESRLGQLLDRAYGTMVLVLGLDELVPVRNPERLKRELRRCFPLLDSLLTPPDSLGGGRLPRPPPGPPQHQLQERLEAFSLWGGSGPCCLQGGGRVLLATPPWRALPPPDAALLGGLLGGAPPTTARDLPLFLPHGSPTVPVRLLVLPLVPGLWLLLLCGPRPSLLQATQVVPRFWSPVLEELRGCARPPPPPLPPGVLAYLLIDRQQHSTQSGIGPGGAQDSSLPPRRRGAVLRRLHALLGPPHFPEDEGGAAPPRLCFVSLPSVTACALLSPPRLLLLLLPPRAPRSRLPALAWGALRALGGS